jgi:hypothetical protein
MAQSVSVPFELGHHLLAAPQYSDFKDLNAAILPQIPEYRRIAPKPRQSA